MALVISLTAFSLCVALSVGKEPACSKFHYEERMLEKMVRVEFEMERFKEQFNDLRKELSTEIKNMRSEIETHITEGANKISESLTKTEKRIVDMEKESEVVRDKLLATAKNLTDEMVLFKDANTIPLVSFRARSPTNMSPTYGDTIVYQTVDANHGGGYDPSTGEFTAPVTGLYSFTVNLCIVKSDEMQISIRKDNVALAGTRSKDTDHVHCVSLQANTVVLINEKVNVYVPEPSKMYDAYPNSFNIFSGYLVHI